MRLFFNRNVDVCKSICASIYRSMGCVDVGYIKICIFCLHKCNVVVREKQKQACYSHINANDIYISYLDK